MFISILTTLTLKPMLRVEETLYDYRRNHFMKVFRQYYYTLVDLRAPKFKLSDLKTLFRKHHTSAVLAG